MQYIDGFGLDAVLDELRRLREAESASLGTVSRTARWPGSARRPPSGPRFPAFPDQRDRCGAVAGGWPVPRECITSAGRGLRLRTSRRRRPNSLRRSFLRSSCRPDHASVIRTGSGELSTQSDPRRPYFQFVARIGVQVAEALEYANRQGVLHRDIKPSNLLLDGGGTVWVTDFGLAKTIGVDDLTATGDIVGTVRYMAPERFQGQCDARSDIYSLGLSLYELAAQRPAFEEGIVSD